MLKVIFHCFGNSKVGLGHVYRCLAVSKFLEQEYSISFITDLETQSIFQSIFPNSYQIIALGKERFSEDIFWERFSESIVVLDGYEFDESYQKLITNSVYKLVYIDDIPKWKYNVDAIINHNPTISVNDYSTGCPTRFFLGLDYLMLRETFLKSNGKSKKCQDRIFICFGGADNENYTLSALKTILKLTPFDWCIDIVIGSAFSHKESLNSFIANSLKEISIHSSLSSDEMKSVMNSTRIGVCAASTIALEYLSTGGELYITKTAKNQELLYDALVDCDYAKDFISFSLSTKQKKLYSPIDGNQPQRFRKIFKELFLEFRRANKGDLLTYFKWANDPITRNNSYNKDEISIGTHSNWYLDKIDSKDYHFFIGVYQMMNVGQVRFQKFVNHWLISFSLSSEFRGKGFGEVLLRGAIFELKKNIGEQFEIVGYVKNSNTASLRIFRNIGFSESESTTYADSKMFILNE